MTLRELMPSGVPPGYDKCTVVIRQSGSADSLEVRGFVSDTTLVVEEQPGFEIDASIPEDDPRAHNCDWMGCGQCHVMLRIDLTLDGAAAEAAQ